ncbi:GmrSD restriction endonuclease domain-containing protein [Helicobacter pylori]
MAQKRRWKKIEQLFDSILRGYPIGSFLFWKLPKEDIAKSDEQDSDKLNFQLYQFITNYDERKPHNEKIRIEQIKRDDLYIVLDGQQRLTSLYIGLKGTRTLKKKKARNDNPNAYEEKRLYLNLKHQPNMDNPEDNYEFEFHAKTPENDKKHWWFKVGDILELKNVWNYAQEHGLKDNELDLLENLSKAFHTKQLISFFEETEKDLDKVLNIFIRVNSGGVKLSYSDLAYFYFLNSKMNESDEEQALKFIRNAQITSYFTPSTDTKLNNIAHSMKDAPTFESFNHNLAKHETSPLKITNDAIEEKMCSSSHARVFPILQILYPNLKYKTTTFHIDHIYPKSKFKKENKKLDKDFYECGNHLFNLQLLEGAENIAKKDKDPEVWLKEEYKDNQQAIEEYKRKKYIDPNLKLEWENIKEFREKREEAIIKRLKEVLLPKS